MSNSATPWTVTHQAPLSLGSSGQEYWGGLPFLPPGDLFDPGIKPTSRALQVDSSPLSHLSRNLAHTDSGSFPGRREPHVSWMDAVWQEGSSIVSDEKKMQRRVSVYHAAKGPGASRPPWGENTPKLQGPQPRSLFRAVQGLGVRQAKQLFLSHCSMAAKWNCFHGRLWREGWRDTTSSSKGRLLGWSQEHSLQSWGGGPLWTWAEVCPRPTGCPLRGCHAGSGSAGVEGDGRLHGGVSLPAGIGRLEPAALALAGRTQSKSAQPPQCQGREQACGSRSASVGGAFVPTWLPPGAWPSCTPPIL